MFEYIALLRAEGPQRWIYEEIARIAEIEFGFLDEEEESDLVERLCVEMGPYHKRDRRDLLTASVCPVTLSSLEEYLPSSDTFSHVVMLYTIF